MKVCKGCHQELDESQFHSSKNTKDGLRGKCKACAHAKDMAWRAANPDKVRAIAHRVNHTEAAVERRKRYKERRRAEINGRAAMYRKQHPDRMFAYSCVISAIRRGLLVRQPCEVCGSTTVEAHHDSYALNDIFRVRWLCRKHHDELHHP